MLMFVVSPKPSLPFHWMSLPVETPLSSSRMVASVMVSVPLLLSTTRGRMVSPASVLAGTSRMLIRLPLTGTGCALWAPLVVM